MTAVDMSLIDESLCKHMEDKIVIAFVVRIHLCITYIDVRTTAVSILNMLMLSMALIVASGSCGDDVQGNKFFYSNINSL